MKDFLLHIIITISYFLPATLGYNMVFGKGKIFHFGIVGVSIVEAYAMFIVLIKSGSYPLAIAAGLAASAVISIILAQISLRLAGDALGVLSIAAHLIILAIVLNWTSLTRGALGIPQIPRMHMVKSMGAYAVFSLITASLVLAFYLWLQKRAFWRQLAALAEQKWHAQSLGIGDAKVTMIAFAVLGASQVVSSLLSVPYLGILHPNDYGFNTLVFYVMAVVAGGPGSIRGATIAVILLSLLKEGLRFVPLPIGITGPAELILFGLILFSAVWIRRDVLFPKQRTV